jgi:hypothetical protein
VQQQGPGAPAEKASQKGVRNIEDQKEGKEEIIKDHIVGISHVKAQMAN